MPQTPIKKTTRLYTGASKLSAVTPLAAPQVASGVPAYSLHAKPTDAQFLCRHPACSSADCKRRAVTKTADRQNIPLHHPPPPIAKNAPVRPLPGGSHKNTGGGISEEGCRGDRGASAVLPRSVRVPARLGAWCGSDHRGMGGNDKRRAPALCAGAGADLCGCLFGSEQGQRC